MFDSRNDKTSRRQQQQPKMPIADFKSTILETISQSPISILVAETGAGKSTQVVQYLVDEGYQPLITQPRRLAARTVATRVAQERGEELGGTFGLRTSTDRVVSQNTKALFCTDGLALVRELMGAGRNYDVLIIDEVHEWNENIEVLVAWAKREIAQGAKFKLVLMSATLEAERLAEYCGGAPVISVPGKVFPVEVREPKPTMIESVKELLDERRNILIFQPGTNEIHQMIEAVRGLNIDAEVLPLYSELEPGEQKKCFKSYDKPKVIVATNVAQTSLTIEDIDAVIDSGLEKRIEVVDGVEGLYLRPISLADSKQRSGRAGRTKPGIYIDFCPTTERSEFSVAEIERVRLDMAYLRLAIAGIDMEQLEFFHQPSKEALRETKRAHIALGTITEDGEVTPIGREVAKLPLSVNIGRMVVEAKKRGVLADVVTIAAILEVGGIVSHKSTEWHSLTGGERESDLLAQLAVFKAIEGMRTNEMREKGINTRSYYRAKEIKRSIRDTVLRNGAYKTSGERAELLKCICAGMVDNLFEHRGYGNLMNNGERRIGKGSVVQLTRSDPWVVGLPFDLEVTNSRGQHVLNLITLATKVDLQVLEEVAPHLVREVTGLDPKYNPKIDAVESTCRRFFNSVCVKESREPDADHPDAARLFEEWVIAEGRAARRHAPSCYPEHVKEILKALKDADDQRSYSQYLNEKAGQRLFSPSTFEEVKQHIIQALQGARCALKVPDAQALRLPPIDPALERKVEQGNPESIQVGSLGSQIVYYSNEGPSIVVGPGWRKLPDHNIFLPNGRQVAVTVRTERGVLVEQEKDILEAKRLAAEREEEMPPVKQAPYQPRPLDLWNDCWS